MFRFLRLPRFPCSHVYAFTRSTSTRSSLHIPCLQTGTCCLCNLVVHTASVHVATPSPALRCYSRTLRGQAMDRITAWMDYSNGLNTFSPNFIRFHIAVQRYEQSKLGFKNATLPSWQKQITTAFLTKLLSRYFIIICDDLNAAQLWYNPCTTTLRYALVIITSLAVCTQNFRVETQSPPSAWTRANNHVI